MFTVKRFPWEFSWIGMMNTKSVAWNNGVLDLL